MHCRFIGDVSRDEVVGLLQHTEGILAREGRLFTINDVKELGRVPAEARRAASDWMKTHRYDGGVVFGLGVITRASMELVVAAINLLRSEPIHIKLCVTEQEGRAWIAARIRESA